MEIDPQYIGHSVATIIEVLLLDAGYQVVPTGIERTIRELRTVKGFDVYRKLSPKRLRTIPDFFVLDSEAKQGWMTEVKFRRRVSSSFLSDLETIQEHWAPFVLILASAEPPKDWGSGVVRHIRAFRIKPETQLDKKFICKGWERLQDVFSRLAERWPDETIIKAEELILRIGLREPEDPFGD